MVYSLSMVLTPGSNLKYLRHLKVKYRFSGVHVMISITEPEGEFFFLSNKTLCKCKGHSE